MGDTRNWREIGRQDGVWGTYQPGAIVGADREAYDAGHVEGAAVREAAVHAEGDHAYAQRLIREHRGSVVGESARDFLEEHVQVIGVCVPPAPRKAEGS